MIAHYITGFSLGGIALLSIIAASSSDISISGNALRHSSTIASWCPDWRTLD
jgi:hypothetical protein